MSEECLKILAVPAGLCLLILALEDAINTIVLARRTRHIFRIARLYYKTTWGPFAALARRIRAPLYREGFLGVYGPVSLLLLLALWTVSMVLGFALLQWAAGMHTQERGPSFPNAVYWSATTLFSLTNGGPANAASKAISVFEAGLGIGILGLVVGYLPILYQSFSGRETTISMLDARAGSPPTAAGLIDSAPMSRQHLEQELARWERWATQLLENQLSFPMLSYFRSQHSNQSWLTALVAITDFASLASLTAKNDLRRQAALTFAIGCHVMVDIAAEFGLQADAKRAETEVRLSDRQFQTLRDSLSKRAGLFDGGMLERVKLDQRCKMYQAHAIALSNYFLMSLPTWVPDEANRRNWNAPLSERDETPFAVSDPFSRQQEEQGVRDSSSRPAPSE